LDSCGAAGCHANADTLTAFHRGLGDHALSQCGSCHAPHSWKVESTDCLACHRAILRDDARLPTRRAENRQRRLPSGPNAGEEAADPWDAMPRAQAPRRRGAPPDSFSHARHRAVACTACHSARRTHGEVTVRAKGECQACHHAADARAGPCEACHTSSALGVVASSVRIPVRVAGRAAVERALSFTHAQHTTQPCASCHADDVAKSVKVACGSCHADHHGPRTACVACHTDSRRGHDREAHLGCASCHTEETAAALPPRRQVCLACHREQETHYPGRECAPCHRTSWPTKQP
jgi:hypothetical protein